MAIFIQWTETSKEFVSQRYVGGGITVVDMKDVTIIKKARYSNDVTPEMKRCAKEYIKTNMQDTPSAKVVILDE